MRYKFCPNCGEKLDGDYKFCPFCGVSFLNDEETGEEPKNEEKTKTTSNESVDDLLAAFDVKVKEKDELEAEKSKKLSKAKSFLDEEDYSEAETSFRLFINDYPDTFDGYYGVLLALSKNFRDFSNDKLHFSMETLEKRFPDKMKQDASYLRFKKGLEEHQKELRLKEKETKTIEWKAFLESEYGLVFKDESNVLFGYYPSSEEADISAPLWGLGKRFSQHIRQPYAEKVMKITLLAKKQDVYLLAKPIPWTILAKKGNLLTLVSKTPLFCCQFNEAFKEKNKELYENSSLYPLWKGQHQNIHDFLLEFCFTSSQRSLLVKEEKTTASLRMLSLDDFQKYKNKIEFLDEFDVYPYFYDACLKRTSEKKLISDEPFFLRTPAKEDFVYCVDKNKNVLSRNAFYFGSFLPVIEISLPE